MEEDSTRAVTSQGRLFILFPIAHYHTRQRVYGASEVACSKVYRLLLVCPFEVLREVPIDSVDTSITTK